jgi:Tfp pilus assembly protein PilO
MTKVAGSKREQQIRVGGIALLAVLVLWAYYAYLLTPMFRRALQLGRDIQTKRTALQHLEQALAQEPRERQAHQQLTEEIHTFSTSLPSEERLPSVIELLSDVANQTGVKIKVIFPQRSADEEGSKKAVAKTPELSKEIPIQIDALAGFHQLGSFLSRVEADPQPIQLRSLRINGNATEPRRHTVKIVLVAYFTVASGQSPSSGGTL